MSDDPIRLVSIIIVRGDEGREMLFEIDPDHWDFKVSRDFEDVTTADKGFKEHVALPSGDIEFKGKYQHSQSALVPTDLGPRIELRGLMFDFHDTTAQIDVTPFKGADREVIAGVQGWSLTLVSTGEQSMSPGNMAKWLEDHLGRGPIRVTLAPEVAYE